MAKSVIDMFLAYGLGGGYFSTATAEAYRSDLQAVVRWAKSSRKFSSWSSATTEDFELYVSVLVAEGKEMCTVNRVLSALSSFYGWALVHRHVRSNPIAAVRRPRNTLHRRSAISMDAVRKALLREDLLPSTKALIALMAESGIRIGEAMTLKPSDVSIAHREAYVKGKGRSFRKVYFGDMTAIFLDAYMQGKQFPSSLFPNSRREYNWEVHNALKPFVGVAKVSPHVLRHTFATESISNGMPLDVLQDALGHKSIETTMVYLHSDSSRIKRINESYAPRI